jgi:AraC-like DNA-binding protein
MSNFYEILLIMGIGWAISGIVQLNLKMDKNNSDVPYAVAIIVVFLLNILDNILRPTFIDMSILVYIYPVTRLSYLLIGPVLFLYVRVLLVKEYRFKRIEVLHLIPFILFFIYILYNPSIIHPKIIFGSGAEDIKYNIKNPLVSMFNIWDLSIHISRFIYLSIIMLHIQKLKKTLPDVVSIFNKHNTLSWFRNLIILYVIIYFLSFLSFLFLIEDNVFYQNYSAFARNIPPVIFLFFFTIFSLKQYRLPETQITNSKVIEKKYNKSGFNEKECMSLYLKICGYINCSKLYLDTELTLNELAEQMQETRHRVSEAINRGSGINFYSFINSFRLEEFVESVKSNRFPNYTIISVAFECGFGSTSAFYKLFKKEYNITPKQFIDNNLLVKIKNDTIKRL